MMCIIDCGTSYIHFLQKDLREFDYTSKVVNLEEIEKNSFKFISGIIISGSPILLTKTDHRKYLNLFSFIKTTSIPILGICFGHQIIGLLYGADISIGKKINKKESIDFVKSDVLFSNIENPSLFQEEHSEHITLPKNFFLLAKSKSCENEAMKHKSKLIYGVQFHPEVSSNNGKRVLENFLKLCSKK